MVLKIWGVSITYRIFNIQKKYSCNFGISDSTAHFLNGVFVQNDHLTVRQNLPADFVENLVGRRTTCPKPSPDRVLSPKNVIPHGDKVLGVQSSIFGPDSCTIPWFRRISILYQGKSSKTGIRVAQRVLSRARVPYPPGKNRGAHQSKVLGVRGSIFGPDSCTIRRFRLIAILYQGKSPNSLVSVHNCQKSKEEIRTSSAKKTRTKNTIFSWRNLILKIFEKILFSKNIFREFRFPEKLKIF